MTTDQIIESWNRGRIPVEERLRQALVEIERLKADLDQMRGFRDGLAKIGAELGAENERLRAGLDRACDALLSSEWDSDRNTASAILNAAYPRQDEQIGRQEG
jgi:hypothetical protein